MSATETPVKPKLAPGKIFAVLNASGDIVAVNDDAAKIDPLHAGKVVVVYNKAYARRLVVKQNLSLESVRGA